MRSARIVVWIIALATTAGACRASLQRPDGPADDPAVTHRLPVVTAPLMPSVPTIDGAVHRAEWASAAQLAGLIALDRGMATDDPHEVFIGYTGDALHIAFRFRRPSFAPPPHSGGDPMRVWRDDCMEMFLMPDATRREQYNFVANAAGIHEEGIRTSATNKSWEAEWDYAARLTETGWEGEMTIPFASLGVTPPEPGSVWAFTMTNNQKTPRANPSSWSFLSEWKAYQDFGYLIFGGDTVAVRLRKAGEVSRSEVGASVEVANFTADDTTVTVRTTLYQAEGEDPGWFANFASAADPLARQGEADYAVPATKVLPKALGAYRTIEAAEREFTVPAGRSRRLGFARACERGSYVLHYEVTEAGGGILAAGPLPFARRAPLEVVLTPYLLSTQAVEVTADYRRVPGVREGDEVRVSLVAAGGTKPLREMQVRVNAGEGLTIRDLDVRNVTPGDYVVACSIVGPQGEDRAAREQDLHIAPTPEWWDHPVGHPEATDTVPPPWTPMRRTERGFEVWNRAIVLADLLQPEQITNGEAEMLASPATLDLELGGLQVGPAEVTRERKTGIAWRAPISGDTVTGEIVLESEFDGFMKYTLRLAPRDERGWLDRLVLAIPLKAELARFYNHGSLGTPPGHSLVTRRNEAGPMPLDGLPLPFTPTTWVGNYEMGLNWVAETDRWWKPADPERAAVYERRGDACVLRINFVEQRREFTEPIEYQWALLATPSKPMNEEFLHNLYLVQSGFKVNEEMTALADNTEAYIDATVAGGANAFIQWSWPKQSVWNDDFSMPAYRPTAINEIKRKAFRQAVAMAHEKGIRRVLAYVLWLVPSDWPGLGEFWNEMPLHPLIPMGNGYKECSAKPFADWHIHTLARTIEDLGLDGVYLDGGANPRVCTNLHHGHGYYDDEGNLHGEYGFFAKREHLKRIYFLMHGGLLDDGLVYVHHSGVFHPVIESFADIHHGGEGTDFTMDDFVGKFYGRPFGLPVTFTRWNVPWYPETRIRSWRLALLADATIKATPSMIIEAGSVPDYRKQTRERMHRGYADNSQPVWLIWQAHKRFPWEGSRWVPYWEIEPYAQVTGERLYACMHLKPGEAALMTVSSFNDEALTVNVAVDWAKMGFDPNHLAITDVITGEPVEFTPEGMALEILEQRFRLLEIRPAG